MGNLPCFAPAVHSLAGANGVLVIGSRVQTQYTLDEGGDGLYYTGTVTELHSGGEASIRYDDGDSWTGSAMFCFLLPHNHPGLQHRLPGGMPSQHTGSIMQAVPVDHGIVQAVPVVEAVPVGP